MQEAAGGNVMKLKEKSEERKEMVSLRDIFQISSPSGMIFEI